VEKETYKYTDTQTPPLNTLSTWLPPTCVRNKQTWAPQTRWDGVKEHTKSFGLYREASTMFTHKL